MWKILVGLGILIMLTACGSTAVQPTQNNPVSVKDDLLERMKERLKELESPTIVPREIVQVQNIGETETLTNWETQKECEAALIKRAVKSADGKPLALNPFLGPYILRVGENVVRFDPARICRGYLHFAQRTPVDLNKFIREQARELDIQDRLACLEHNTRPYNYPRECP